MNTPRTTLYRDKQNAKLMGVCSGIADYTGINAIWTRLIALAGIPISGGAIIPIYFLMGLLLNKKPAHLYVEPQEQRYWQGVRQNPRRAAREIRGRMREIDRRLADVENFYVSNNPRLTAQIEDLR